MTNLLAQLKDRAARPIDAASLATLRWMFGWLMFVDILRYLRYGWVKSYYIDPSFHFTYWGFSYLEPLPGALMYGVFGLLAACALGIAVGFFYRLSAITYTLVFAYVFLIEKAHYLNHFYVIILLSALLAAMPAHRLWSADADRGRVPASDYIPAWPVWLIRAQLIIVYVYAGIAKLNSDWLAGRPLDMWLDPHRDVPLIGEFLAGDTFSLIASYSGIFIDLVLGPALLFRKLRVIALLGMASFHLANAFLFSIGIFPWMMLGANLIFLDPDWPRRLPKFFNKFVDLRELRKKEPEPTDAMPRALGRWGLVAVGAWLTFQILFPLRHLLYPGDVAWTEEGHRFSWRMKLRDKHGPTEMFVADPETGQRTRLDLKKDLNKRQIRKMSCHPDMILEYAHYVADRVERQGKARPQIFARALCSLNGHPARDLIDRDADLAAQPWSIGKAPFILRDTSFRSEPQRNVVASEPEDD